MPMSLAARSAGTSSRSPSHRTRVREAQRVGAGPEHRPGAVVPAGAEENPVGRQLPGDRARASRRSACPLYGMRLAGVVRTSAVGAISRRARISLAGREALEGVQVDPVVDEPETLAWHAFGGQLAHDCPELPSAAAMRRCSRRSSHASAGCFRW